MDLGIMRDSTDVHFEYRGAWEEWSVMVEKVEVEDSTNDD